MVTASGKTKRSRGKGKATAEGSVKSAGREKTVDRERQATAYVPDDEDEEDEGGEDMVEDGEAVDKIAEKKKLEYARKY